MTISSKNYTRYHYERAPLQEVIFETKFFDESYDITLPGSFFESVSCEFPLKKTIQPNAFIFSNQPITEEKPPQIQAPVIQTWNNKREKCLQVGPGIIAANDRAYKNWEDFSKTIKTLLDKYFDCASPSSLQRVGYRCINRILIPGKEIALADYFRIGFALPNELLDPNGLSFSISKELAFNDIKISVIVRFSTDSLKDCETGTALLLDIDTFVTEIIDVDIDKQAILEAATQCHDVEKIVFESLLKDKLRELLGGKKV